MTNKTPYKYYKHIEYAQHTVPPSEYYTDDPTLYSDQTSHCILPIAIQREIVDGNLFIRSLLKAMRTTSNRYAIRYIHKTVAHAISAIVLCYPFFYIGTHFCDQLRTRRVVKVYFISCKCNPINSLSYDIYI